MTERDRMVAMLEGDKIAQALIRSRARPECEKRRDRLRDLIAYLEGREGDPVRIHNPELLAEDLKAEMGECDPDE